MCKHNLVWFIVLVCNSTSMHRRGPNIGRAPFWSEWPQIHPAEGSPPAHSFGGGTYFQTHYQAEHKQYMPAKGRLVRLKPGRC